MARILNAADSDAKVKITVHFVERERAGPYGLTVPAPPHAACPLQRSQGPRAISEDTDYWSVIVSIIPVAAQHTRLDTRQPGACAPQHCRATGQERKRVGAADPCIRKLHLLRDGAF